MSTFTAAIEAGDIDAVVAMLADDVLFRSPVAFKPYPGKAITSAFLRGFIDVVDDLHYLREMHDENGRSHALVFEAKVDGLTITGCDFLQYDEHGKISDFMVMVRPLRGIEALEARMREKITQIQASPAAAASEKA